MASKQLSKLSPRAERTRAALIAAGFELLVERPIDGIPIDELVAKAGVAKGSFFNHFRDKKDLERAIGAEVRQEIEDLVAAANAGITNPVERLVGGMRVAAEFALNQPKRSAVSSRSASGSTAREHPLNKGLVDDIDEACSLGLLRPEARETGVLYWLGLCQILMINILENRGDKRHAHRLTADMIVLGLTGLGVSEAQSRELARLI